VSAYRPLPSLANRYSGIIECLAECDECDFAATNRKNALALASQHARRTGHQVHAEQTIGVTYNRKDGVAHKFEIV
jgi:hypothetical protein